MNISLKGKRALICGSTQGIGLAIAKELAGAGANCLLMARNESLLQSIVNDLPKSDGQQHAYAVADFTDNHQVSTAVHAALATAPIHILINNTGGPKPGAITEAEPAAFVAAFQQHLVNNQALVQAVLPGMKAAQYGRIINIISTSVRIPIANLGVSNTIRGAVASWAKTLSNETGQYNVTVNNILPGLTATARLEALIENTAQNRAQPVSVIRNEMIQSIPMKRFGEAEEIANVVAFLASPAAAYVNGTSIPVDGGRTGTI